MLFAHHGVTEQERSEGRNFRFDLAISLPRATGRRLADDLGQSVDYAKVVSVVCEVALGNRFRTVEKLAEVICEEIIARFNRAEEVKVKILKIDPPTPRPVQAAGVEIVRRCGW